MSIFLTGGTGFLGSYVIPELLERTDERITVFTRGRDLDEAKQKLWRSLQLHFSADQFFDALERIDFAMGDLHGQNLGLGDQWEPIAERTTSILHVAASLNRKSSKACFNTNLRGSLSMIRLAQESVKRGGLKRFSAVSTVAVCGKRHAEVVGEDQAIDWNLSDYDPYGRTKKFAEHMLFELLPDVPKTIFRPSIVMGDTRKPETTQFDMVRAFVGLAKLPLLPVEPHARQDIVPADFVGEAIARLHLKEKTQWERYHLSAGTRSCCTPEEIGEALASLGVGYRLTPRLDKPFEWIVRGMNRMPRGSSSQRIGAMMKVFWPYITYDTVFDNTRVCTELGITPAKFTTYAPGLFEFANRVKFKYPYRPLPNGKRERAA